MKPQKPNRVKNSESDGNLAWKSGGTIPRDFVVSLLSEPAGHQPDSDKEDENEAQVLQQEKHLRASCVSGDVSNVKTLLEAKVNVNASNEDGRSGLWFAAQNGHTEIITLLLQAKADINHCNQGGASALWIASQNGHAVALKQLLVWKPNLNNPAKGGATALWIACQNGHKEISTMLLQARADPHKPAQGNASPLWITCQHGHVAIINLLLDSYKADPNHRVEGGASCVWIASQNGHTEVVNALIAKKADVNIPEKSGWTPLMGAAAKGHTGVVKALLNGGADSSRKNKQGETAAQWAVSMGFPMLAELIKAHTNNPSDLSLTGALAASPIVHSELLAAFQRVMGQPLTILCSELYNHRQLLPASDSLHEAAIPASPTSPASPTTRPSLSSGGPTPVIFFTESIKQIPIFARELQNIHLHSAWDKLPLRTQRALWLSTKKLFQLAIQEHELRLCVTLGESVDEDQLEEPLSLIEPVTFSTSISVSGPAAAQSDDPFAVNPGWQAKPELELSTNLGVPSLGGGRFRGMSTHDPSPRPIDPSLTPILQSLQQCRLQWHVYPASNEQQLVFPLREVPSLVLASPTIVCNPKAQTLLWIIPPASSPRQSAMLNLIQNGMYLTSVKLDYIWAVRRDSQSPFGVNVVFQLPPTSRRSTAVPNGPLTITTPQSRAALEVPQQPSQQQTMTLEFCSSTHAQEIRILLKRAIGGQFGGLSSGLVCLHKGFIELASSNSPPAKVYARLMKGRLVVYPSPDASLPNLVISLGVGSEVRPSKRAGFSLAIKNELDTFDINATSAQDRGLWEAALKCEKEFDERLADLLIPPPDPLPPRPPARRPPKHDPELAVSPPSSPTDSKRPKKGRAVTELKPKVVKEKRPSAKSAAALPPPAKPEEDEPPPAFVEAEEEIPPPPPEDEEEVSWIEMLEMMDPKKASRISVVKGPSSKAKAAAAAAGPSSPTNKSASKSTTASSASSVSPRSAKSAKTVTIASDSSSIPVSSVPVHQRKKTVFGESNQEEEDEDAMLAAVSTKKLRSKKSLKHVGFSSEPKVVEQENHDNHEEPEDEHHDLPLAPNPPTTASANGTAAEGAGADGSGADGTAAGDDAEDGADAASSVNGAVAAPAGAAVALPGGLVPSMRLMEIMKLATKQSHYFAFILSFRTFDIVKSTSLSLAEWHVESKTSVLGMRGKTTRLIDQALELYLEYTRVGVNRLKHARLCVTENSEAQSAANQIGFAFPGFDSQVFDVGRFACVCPWQLLCANDDLSFQASDYNGAFMSTCVAKELMQSSPDVSSLFDTDPAKAKVLMSEAQLQVLHNIYLSAYLRAHERAYRQKSLNSGDIIPWSTVMSQFQGAPNREHLESWAGLSYIYNPSVNKLLQILQSSITRPGGEEDDKEKAEKQRSISVSPSTTKPGYYDNMRVMADPIHFLIVFRLVMESRKNVLQALISHISTWIAEHSHAMQTRRFEAVLKLNRRAQADDASMAALLRTLPNTSMLAQIAKTQTHVTVAEMISSFLPVRPKTAELVNKGIMKPEQDEEVLRNFEIQHRKTLSARNLKTDEEKEGKDSKESRSSDQSKDSHYYHPVSAPASPTTSGAFPAASSSPSSVPSSPTSSSTSISNVAAMHSSGTHTFLAPLPPKPTKRPPPLPNSVVQNSSGTHQNSASQSSPSVGPNSGTTSPAMASPAQGVLVSGSAAASGSSAAVMSGSATGGLSGSSPAGASGATSTNAMPSPGPPLANVTVSPVMSPRPPPRLGSFKISGSLNGISTAFFSSNSDDKKKSGR